MILRALASAFSALHLETVSPFTHVFAICMLPIFATKISTSRGKKQNEDSVAFFLLTWGLPHHLQAGPEVLKLRREHIVPCATSQTNSNYYEYILITNLMH